ncbi:MAG TPA: TolC family protein [Gemmatimonadaceae bacterium]|nr:TolC family protein [Gemmatimonadaceae bacterium]
MTFTDIIIMRSAPSRSTRRAASRRPSRVVAASLTLAALCAGAAGAQQPAAPRSVPATVTLSLDDALRMAATQSQTIEIARAGVTRASGSRYQARSLYLPQLNGTAGYTKTLKSQFSSFASSAPKDTAPTPAASKSLCTPFIPENATDAERAAALAQAATCPSASGGFDLSKTSFGATNQWAFGLQFSQNLWTAGRVTAQNRAADAQLRSAKIEVAAQSAQVALDVTSAYYDAVLADQLVSIADSSVAETQAVLAQTQVARQVGNASEYDLLRAQVTHDNQLPVAIQARANRQVAYLRLKQLLNMALDDSLRLTTRIEEPSGPTLPAIATNAPPPDTIAADRAPVLQMDESVRAAQAQVTIARAERIPQFALVSNYQRLYFPSQVFPNLNNGVNNWTVGVSTSLPILDGGRIKGDELIAQAALQQARAQREQTRQFAALDTRVALNALQEAQSTWEASRGTAEQAQRAYAIDQVRFREGISTQTDLTQSRLLLEQALANRAQAARNLAVARVRLALLRDLPLQSTTGTAASATGGAAGATQQQSQQQQQQSTQQRSATTSPSATGTAGTTGSIQP